MKSMICNVFWPSWEWGPKNMPHLRYICAAHQQGLAIRDSTKMRRLVTSEWYQKHWGDRVKLTGDQNAKTKFETTATGFREAMAAGSITGSRGDRLILDDPHSVEGANSDAMRATTLEWFTEAVPTRLNNPKTSAIICIMQRLHEEDVSGVILERKGFQGVYDHICLPMRYEAWREGVTTKLGYADPREEEGELLFPQRFPPEVVDRDEAAMGPYAVASQHQQVPSPRGGNVIKDSWWQLWDHTHFPNLDFIVASIDTAYSSKAEERGDFSAMTIWGVFSGDPAATATRSVDRYGKGFDGYVNTSYTSDLNAVPRVILMRAWAERLELHELVEKIAKDCKALKVDKLLIENKAAGHSVAQEIRRLFSHEPWAVQMYDPKSIDKLGRLYSVQHLFAEGMIYAPGTTWAEAVIRQVSSFPRGKHDDLVDTVSMALRHLRDLGLLTRSPERLAEINESKTQYGKPPPPLYDV
jgi:predicted phage terminase large subunit-like protein